MPNTMGTELIENWELEYEIWDRRLSDENWAMKTEIWVSREPNRATCLKKILFLLTLSSFLSKSANCIYVNFGYRTRNNSTTEVRGMAPYGYGYPAATPLVHGESSIRAERNQRRRDMNYRSLDEVNLFIYILFYFIFSF